MGESNLAAERPVAFQIGINLGDIVIDDDILREGLNVDIVRRFGRFPHRNLVLGRAMTEMEQRFLDEGGLCRMMDPKAGKSFRFAGRGPAS